MNYVFSSTESARGNWHSLEKVGLGAFMGHLDRERRWNGWVVALLSAGAVLGFSNSVLQLSRYGTDVASRLGSADWTMIIIWGVLLVVWALVLGILSGIAIGRHWYGVSDGVVDGVSPRSMASSD